MREGRLYPVEKDANGLRISVNKPGREFCIQPAGGARGFPVTLKFDDSEARTRILEGPVQDLELEPFQRLELRLGPEAKVGDKWNITIGSKARAGLTQLPAVDSGGRLAVVGPGVTVLATMFADTFLSSLSNDGSPVWWNADFPDELRRSAGRPWDVSGFGSAALICVVDCNQLVPVNAVTIASHLELTDGGGNWLTSLPMGSVNDLVQGSSGFIQVGGGVKEVSTQLFAWGPRWPWVRPRFQADLEFYALQTGGFIQLVGW